MKKINKTPVENTFESIEQNLKSSDNAGLIDSAEQPISAEPNLDSAAVTESVQLSDTTEVDKNAYVDLVNDVVRRVRETGKPVQPGHSLLSAEDYEGLTPDIKVSRKGFTSFDTKRQMEDLAGFSSAGAVPVVTSSRSTDGQLKARPATKLDLANLDESQIMDIPEISASDFQVVDMLNLVPKNPEIRFRWVNFKNFVAGNYGRYLAYGFQTASVDDVDVEKTPVHDSMINGTKVEYYDVQLMKIHVLKLMALYKKNVLSSIGRLRNFKEAGMAAANKQFNDDIASSPALQAGLHKMKIANQGENPIEFYDPGRV